ncbi:hypothetical protein BBB02_00085 [Wolbachia endosymbiont of Bemisia tabaci]|uniref:hypothetical protein n=1 Tax=Wolbachia endosymbiont of Bemisia tabaci TaxID=215173 RepID=UPI000FD16600|nr:hypothetical protein [Wolbachia endosymbiont of Bemisia tabaci]AZU37061.1 hypothetical protein BBB02_00085 [Wolbachia endosymbiont of Bemisia tabaci]
MPTTDSSNTASVPPPPSPPPLPPGGLKNWTPPQDNGNSKKPSNVATSGISSRTELKKGQSKSPVQQSSLNFAKNPLFKKMQEKNNVDSKTADEGSNIRQSEKNRSSTPKPIFPRVLSPQQDNSNSNKPYGNSGINNSTQSEKGLSENPIQLATEQKIDTPILINTLVGISKTAALKYSIATLLLCISSVTAGIYTYLSISVTLSNPVLFTVIASVSALVMFSSAAYLINSFVSAINSEKKIDLQRGKLEDMKDVVDSAANSPTPIQPLVAFDAQPNHSTYIPQPFSEQKKPITPVSNSGDARTALFDDIKKITVRPTMNEEQKRKRDEKIEQSQKKLKEREEKRKEEREKAGKETAEDMKHTLVEKLMSRRTGIAGEKENSLNGVFDKISSMIPSPRNRSSSLSSNNSEGWSNDDECSTNSQSGQSESSDSSHDNTKPEPTIPPKPVNSKTKYEASPAAQANNVDQVNSEMEKPSHSVKEKIKNLQGLNK